VAIDVLQVKDAGNVTRSVVVDNDGSNNLTQINKMAFGADDAVPTLVDYGTPLPIMESRFGAISQRTSGLASSTVATTGLVSSTLRTRVFASNGSASGVWVDFGQAAVVGNGVFLPSKAKDTYYTNLGVSYIIETGGTVGPVSFVGV
jgi:hypothetical protein